MEQKYYIGIDISKEKVDICVMTGTYENVETCICINRITALKYYFNKLLSRLKVTPQEVLVCCESTGIYGRPLERVCVAMNLPLWVELAIKIKNARAELRGKTDAKDAARIADYARRNEDKVRLYQEPPQSVRSLQTLLSSRDSLLLQANQLKQQLKEAQACDMEKYKLLQFCYGKPLKTLTGQLQEIEAEIAAIKEQDVEMKANAALIKSIPGIGDQTALHFIVYTRNFTTFQTANHLACYVGVAPFPEQSGKVKKPDRVSHFANHKLKKLLHLAAMAAIRSKGEIRDYYQRKVKEGKSKMLVLNNVRNKLIKRMYAVLKSRQPYTPNKSEPALVL